MTFLTVLPPDPTPAHAYATKALPLTLPLPLFSDPLILRIRELFPFLSRAPLLSSLLSNNQAVEIETEKAKMYLSDYAKRGTRAWVDGRIVRSGKERALVIWGDQDRPGIGKWLADVMGAQVVYVKGAGGFLHITSVAIMWF